MASVSDIGTYRAGCWGDAVGAAHGIHWSSRGPARGLTNVIDMDTRFPALDHWLGFDRFRNGMGLAPNLAIGINAGHRRRGDPGIVHSDLRATARKAT